MTSPGDAVSYASPSHKGSCFPKKQNPLFGGFCFSFRIETKEKLLALLRSHLLRGLLYGLLSSLLHRLLDGLLHRLLDGLLHGLLYCLFLGCHNDHLLP